MSVTIKDVARAAGVSPITASRCFSGSHPVADATRRRVLAAAKEVDYAPDLLARGLVHKHSSMIGLVVSDLSNPFFVPIIDAVQAIAHEHNLLLVVNQSERQLDIERESLSQFRQMRMSGILVVPISIQREHLVRLRDAGTPVVVIAREWDGGDYVTVDDVEGGRLAGEHLIRLGHCRIGYVALGEPEHTALQARLAGFRQVLQSKGCDVSPQWTILTKTLGVDDGIRAADRFLELPQRPTAIFCPGDQLAIGFLARVQERGLHVPDDVAVIGYDDIRYAEFLKVPLTTVALPKAEMGEQAAQILLDRITNGYQEARLRQVKLAPRLVVQASCGARIIEHAHAE